MATGNISFSALIQGFKLEPIELVSSNPSIKKIIIEAKGEKIIFLFELTDVFDKSEALSVTSPIVELMINRISFKFSIKIENANCNSWSPRVQGDDKSIVLEDIWIGSNVIESIMMPGEKSRNQLIKELEVPTSARDIYLPQFRFAINQDNSLSKFMLLYNLLLMLNNDKQSMVDKCIINIDGNTQVSPQPHKKGNTETIYTRLRNEVAHIRENAIQSKIFEEIKSNVGVFQEIVKKRIESV